MPTRDRQNEMCFILIRHSKQKHISKLGFFFNPSACAYIRSKHTTHTYVNVYLVMIIYIVAANCINSYVYSTIVVISYYVCVCMIDVYAFFVRNKKAKNITIYIRI